MQLAVASFPDRPHGATELFADLFFQERQFGTGLTPSAACMHARTHPLIRGSILILLFASGVRCCCRRFLLSMFHEMEYSMDCQPAEHGSQRDPRISGVSSDAHFRLRPRGIVLQHLSNPGPLRRFIAPSGVSVIGLVVALPPLKIIYDDFV